MTPTDPSQWWRTAIINMQPGVIELRGAPIETLIGEVSFVDMIWRMVVGTPASAEQLRVLEAALVAAVDHGPQAPSVAAARMAATCGVGLNNALATGVNMLGDVHGGAGQQCVALMNSVINEVDRGASVEAAVASVVGAFQTEVSVFVPGFGHRFHRPKDPRAEPLLAVLEATDDEAIDRRYGQVARAIQAQVSEGKSTAIAINIDGATAALYGALGLAPELARGLFCLSRSVGILAHAWEQTQQGGRNKGPLPPEFLWTYTGPKAG